MPKFTIANNSLPIGQYRAEFLGIEATAHVEFGDGLQWKFLVSEGPQKGRTAYRTTKNEPTPKNSCGRFLAALKGEKPADGSEVDPDEFVGKLFDVMVTESQSGESTRIDSFSPANDTPF